MSVPLPRKFHGWKEPGGLQSLGSQRVGHNWATSLSVFFNWCHWGFLLVLPEGIKGVCPAWDAGSLSGMRGFWPQGTKTLLYSRAALSLRYRPHAYYCETFLSPQTLSLSPFPHTPVTLVTLVSLARDRLLRPIKTRGCLVWVLMAGCLLLVTPWNARSLGGSGACYLLLNVPELPVDGAGFVSYTVSPLHTNEFRSESLFIRPICF